MDLQFRSQFLWRKTSAHLPRISNIPSLPPQNNLRDAAFYLAKIPGHYKYCNIFQVYLSAHKSDSNTLVDMAYNYKGGGGVVELRLPLGKR